MLRHLTLGLSLFAAFVACADAQTEAPVAPATSASEVALPANPRVALTTSLGQIVIEVDPVKAPKSAENFLTYVKDGHYAGTIFHRVIDNFMVQGGGFTADLQLKPTRPAIENEANNGLSNLRGTVSMARTNEPHSATAQFFINVVDNPRLDFVSEQNGLWGYAVFGKVVEGMDVIDKIRALETGAQGPLPRDVPKQAVVIEKAEVLPSVKPATAG
ncbi:MAG: peptidyl-prolyl cis-trans isomerase [Xanthomonadales bacterium]|nr:peptidyl-prolyl cis-trans isomerase [Xanthomonadales bacterium]